MSKRLCELDLNGGDQLRHQLMALRLLLVNVVEASPITIHRLRHVPEARGISVSICRTAEKCRAAVHAITEIIGDEPWEEPS